VRGIYSSCQIEKGILPGRSVFICVLLCLVLPSANGAVFWTPWSPDDKTIYISTTPGVHGFEIREGTEYRGGYGANSKKVVWFQYRTCASNTLVQAEHRQTKFKWVVTVNTNPAITRSYWSVTNVTSGSTAKLRANLTVGRAWNFKDPMEFTIQRVDSAEPPILVKGRRTFVPPAYYAEAFWKTRWNGDTNTLQPIAYTFTVAQRTLSSTSVNTLFVFPPKARPYIREQPHDVSAEIGTPASFSVDVLAYPVARYQWFRNNKTIRGATNATLVLNTISRSSPATYHVRVFNSVGATNSLPARLTLLSPKPMLKISATAPPRLVDVIIENGFLHFSIEDQSGRTFQIEATDDLVLSEWQVIAENVEAPQPISIPVDSSQKFFRVRTN
jgi:hypothetical protein